MRPEVLFPLFRPTTALPGVGPRVARLLDQVAGPSVLDLVWHLPTGLVDRSRQPKVATAQPGHIATLTLHVDAHQPAPRPRLPYKVICSDETGHMELVFFNPREDYLKEVLPPGQTRIVSGQIAAYGSILQMAHPDYILPAEKLSEMPLLEPVYGLTAGLSGKVLRRALRGALDGLPALPEWQDPAWLARQGWPAWREAVQAAHNPQAEADLEAAAAPRSRLAYDELLANQLALMLVRNRMKALPGRSTAGDGRLAAKVRARLPYRLTAAQERALAEIQLDMKAPQRMLRLLQGDVGSGKTVVALLAMLGAVEAGAQAALMVPTEILARQHFADLEPLCQTAGVEVALLTGRDKGKRRAELLARLAAGEIGILVGTHALFQDDVEFRDLALAVIDEQHRFGVHQRLGLQRKGGHTDVLVMTATPIPRTLTLTYYGDMEQSVLNEKPPGREPIDTRAIPLGRLDEVIAGIRRAVADGARVYWICPLVEDTDTAPAIAAEARWRELKEFFGERVGLVHGRLKADAKDKVMQQFADGALDVLVATTVIEVGVNVPEATVIVIEQAERFGLAQLHQLRGRVGRGSRRGTCLLLYAEPLGETARARLSILRETDDGFRIAEEDLRLRGAGEVLGTRQSGLPMFRLVSMEAHGALMQAARDDARLILERDDDLQSERGQALRVLLYLFERDAAVRYLRSG